MRVFVPKELASGETRVAIVPESVKKLIKAGFSVEVQSKAGESSSFLDVDYQEVGASISTNIKESYGNADIVARVAPPCEFLDGVSEVELLKEGSLLVGFMAPHHNLEMVAALADRKINCLAMELVPRISRAQAMDALSSQASLGGYKAALLASAYLDKYFPLMMTAAGTVQPARVVVMGAGVAGLQALATCRRLGAIVEVSDIRPEVEEQVASLGGKFIKLPLEEVEKGEGGYAKEVTPEFLRKQQAIVAERVREADVVITTALVPGRPAPKLLTNEMVESMRAGAVIVDMAVSQGGNCALSVRGEIVKHKGVTIIGIDNLPATVPADASTLYSRNIISLLNLAVPKAELNLDLDDEIIRGALLTYSGHVLHEPSREALGGDPLPALVAEKEPEPVAEVEQAETPEEQTSKDSELEAKTQQEQPPADWGQAVESTQAEVKVEAKEEGSAEEELDKTDPSSDTIDEDSKLKEQAMMAKGASNGVSNDATIQGDNS